MLNARARSQVALHAARHIARGEELYSHYGKPFDTNRDYSVGELANLRKCDKYSSTDDGLGERRRFAR